MPRSRTGCLTCRNRKLKCSEEKPTCAQCAKARRECVPSGGITFRHQQNPSMNHGEHGENGSLKSFYGYKETFQKETTWVSVPSKLKFIHTNNPYEDDDAGGYVDHEGNEFTDLGEPYEEAGPGKSDYQFARELAHAAYSHTYPATYPTHGLEALSAVATDQYSYAPPPAPMTQAEHTPQQQSSSTGHEQNQSNASQNLHYILNPTSAGAANSNIDPRLHGEAPVPHSSPDHASSLATIEAQLSSELAND